MLTPADPGGAALSESDQRTAMTDLLLSAHVPVRELEEPPAPLSPTPDPAFAPPAGEPGADGG